MSKKNLVVMFGGPSVEHDVSVITALQVIKNADASKYEVLPLYWTKEGPVVLLRNRQPYTTVQSLIESNTRQPVTFFSGGFKAQDFFGKSYENSVVIPCFHGTDGEDGVAQGLLDFFAIPYAGSNVRASAVGMDKILFKALMKENNIPVLPYQVVTKESGVEPKSLKFDFPVIVKPAHLGSSIGVKKCDGIREVTDALETVFELDTHALIEPYLSDKQEVNVSVLGSTDECQTSVTEEPLSAEDILSFEDKYLRGGKGAAQRALPGGEKNGLKGMASLDRRIPAPIEKNQEARIKKQAEEIFKVCGCSGVARIDFMIDKKTKETYVTEINTIPGSLSFYLWEAAGISFPELIDKLVDIAEHEYKKKAALMRTFESTILQKDI